MCGSVSELKMTSFDRDLEEKLKETGSTLLNPPSSIDDLLTLLDVSFWPQGEGKGDSNC